MCGGGICHIHTGSTPEVQKALYPVLELQILEVHDIHLHYVYKVIHEIYPNYIGFFVHTKKKVDSELNYVDFKKIHWYHK